MKLVRYRTPDGAHTGLLEGDHVVSLDGLRVVDLLKLDPDERDARADAARGPRHPLETVTLDSPIEQPGKFLALGFNFADHVAEQPDLEQQPIADLYETVRLTRQAYPSPRLPTIFNKQTSCITGPFDRVLLPYDTSMLDYEGELVIVIGREGRRVFPEEAGALVAGYTVTNDLSVRDWQWDTQTVWPGKSFDTHGPLGPCIVTADAIDPSDLRVRTWINGDLRQDGSTASMILDVAGIVSTVSQVCSLQAGDLIATGTPGGIGTPSGTFLAPGDVMRVEVEGIGAIENVVVAEEAPLTATPSGDGRYTRT